MVTGLHSVLQRREAAPEKWHHFPDMMSHFHPRYPSLDRLTLTQAPAAVHAVVGPPLACAKACGTPALLARGSALGSRPTGWGCRGYQRAEFCLLRGQCLILGHQLLLACRGFHLSSLEA